MHALVTDGVFPVRTQFELRSIMGILFKIKQKENIIFRWSLAKRMNRTQLPVHTPLRGLHSCWTFEERQRDGIVGQS